MKFDNFFLLIKLLKKKKKDMIQRGFVMPSLASIICFKYIKKVMIQSSSKPKIHCKTQPQPFFSNKSKSSRREHKSSFHARPHDSKVCLVLAPSSGMNYTLWSITITTLPPFTQQVCLYQWHNLFEWRLCLMEFGYLTIY